MDLTDAQELKFGLMAEGLTLDEGAAAWLAEVTGGRSLTPADYASTSGLILDLEGVWVNAPIHAENPNFVPERTAYRLHRDGGGLTVSGRGRTAMARYWPQPDYHGTSNAHGPLNNFVYTHGDRVRLSPIRGCSMTCEFCNIPYDDPLEVYTLKSIEGCIEAIRVALDDRAQPAHHVLVSGGTPKPKDAGFHRELYRRVLDAFAGVAVDIMMVPLPGVLDLPELAAHGVAELSINLEVYSRARAREVARHKYNQGLPFYLDFIERAAEVLGPGRVRSMLLVGLEPVEDTLAGVAAIADRGGVPVLSPFRPDPVTPLRDTPPPSASVLREVFLRARDLAHRRGVPLGPSCPPCSHNTLNFAEGTDGRVGRAHGEPRMEA